MEIFIVDFVGLMFGFMRIAPLIIIGFMIGGKTSKYIYFFSLIYCGAEYFSSRLPVCMPGSFDCISFSARLWISAAIEIGVLSAYLFCLKKLKSMLISA